MCNCGSITSVYSTYPSNRLASDLEEQEKKENCTVTEENVLSYKEKLDCLVGKIPNKEYNKFAGLILTMINLKEYCKYDLEALEKLLVDYGCN